MRTPEIACIFMVTFISSGLVTNTPAGPTLSPGAFDPNCADRIQNCNVFSSESCGGQYEQWARDNCELTCKYCTGPPTSPPPCVDVLEDCAIYDHNACSDPLFGNWAMTNCRRTCRLCPAEVLALLDAQTTTIPPSATSPHLNSTMQAAMIECVDKLDCKPFDKSSCSGRFEPWARENCMNYCGYCVGIPTTPAPCVDNIPTCSQYEPTTCTSDKYRPWAEENCRKFCSFCSGSGPTLPPGSPVRTTALRAPPLPATTLRAPPFPATTLRAPPLPTSSP